ncbi:DUF4136 domain-containing protein [Psychroserpens burtonensis]|uniref:DUF4136 domain-containing protein n=1 Tax=Psychroserpens burtonensis TaxID=49278 RepID=A0A5C7B7T7_9FLAO|nr:DUF4136 domain-containing protein [Psychroserpens burtonensis]TXE15896.1 DUF4136 domain-containing protein [Psychroserpens burtonensis]
MKKLFILLFLIVLTSCSSIYVNYDYDKTTNFKSYKTYNYFSDVNTGMSELDSKRLFKALDSALLSRGYMVSETPDFLIDIKSIEFQQARGSTVGVGVGGVGNNVGGGLSIGLPIGQTKLGREIIFDFVDESNDALFWQAVSESNFKLNASPEKREALFIAIVEKVLKGFPPEIK